MNLQQMTITSDFIREKIKENINVNYIEQLEKIMNIMINPLSNQAEVNIILFNIFLL